MTYMVYMPKNQTKLDFLIGLPSENWALFVSVSNQTGLDTM